MSSTGGSSRKPSRPNNKVQEPEPETRGVDILAQKGYYDNLVTAHEDIVSKRNVLDKDIEVETEEKKKLEKQIQDIQDWLAKMAPTLKKKKKELERIDAQIQEMEADPMKAANKVKYAGMDALQRATFMRNEFKSLISDAAVNAPKALLVSATPRGGGVDAIEVRNVAASTVPVRCYNVPGKSPSQSPAPPAIMFFHGGGFVLGDLETHDQLCKNLCAASGCTVVAVDYRRAPEHKWPAAFDDCYSALSWVADGGLGATPRSLAVAGDCAGGGLAASCCLRARADPNAPRISLQVLFYPLLDLRPSSSSLTSEFADGRYGLSDDDVIYFTNAYAPESSDDSWTEQASASPLAATSLAGLPRAFVAYAVSDMLAGDSTAYVERVRKEIGPEAVHTMRVEGLEHNFAATPADPNAHHVISAAATFASALLWMS